MSHSHRFSCNELMRCAPFQCMLYINLNNYQNLIEAFKGKKALLLLYETKGPEFGHWVTLLRRPHGCIEYFDPYGHGIDWVINTGRWYYGKNTGLSPLARKLRGIRCFQVNRMSHQRKSPLVNTCGAWCYVRWKYRHLSLEQFNRWMHGLRMRGVDTDRMVDRIAHNCSWS